MTDDQRKRIERMGLIVTAEYEARRFREMLLAQSLERLDALEHAKTERGELLLDAATLLAGRKMARS